MGVTLNRPTQSSKLLCMSSRFQNWHRLPLFVRMGVRIFQYLLQWIRFASGSMGPHVRGYRAHAGLATTSKHRTINRIPRAAHASSAPSVCDDVRLEMPISIYARSRDRDAKLPGHPRPSAPPKAPPCRSGLIQKKHSVHAVSWNNLYTCAYDFVSVSMSSKR